MKKHLKLFSLIALAVAGLAVSLSGNNNKVREATADSYRTIYFSNFGGWASSSVGSGIYYGLDGSASRTELTSAVDYTSFTISRHNSKTINVGSFKIPASATSIYFSEKASGGGDANRTKTYTLGEEDYFVMDNNRWYVNQECGYTFFDKPEHIFIDYSKCTCFEDNAIHVEFGIQNSVVDYNIPNRNVMDTVFSSYQNLIQVTVPAYATNIKVYSYKLNSPAQYETYSYTFPEGKDSNLFTVSTNYSNAHQFATWTKPPFDVPDEIHFNLTASGVTADKVTATFYSIDSGSSSGSQQTVTGTTTYSGYKTFAVPSFATRVVFTVNGSTYSSVLPIDERRVAQVVSSTFSFTAKSPDVLMVTTENSANNNTARIILNNSAILLEENYWYNPDSSHVYGVRCWHTTNTVNNASYPSIGYNLPSPTLLSTVSVCYDWELGGGTERTANESSERKYTFADIPKNTEYIRIVILNKTYNEGTGEYEYSLYDGSSNVHEINDSSLFNCYFLKNETERYELVDSSDWLKYGVESVGDTIMHDSTSPATQGVGGNLMKRVLGGVDTCSADARNGYNSYNRIVENFYINPSSSAKNTIVQTVEIASSEKAGLYSPTTVENIMVEMEKRASGSGSSSAVRIPRDYELDSSRIVIIVVISSLSLVAFSIITLYINKKRKHS